MSLTCLIALSFGASPAQALSTSGDGSWFWLSPAPSGAYVWRTSWITQQEGWAVGCDGVVSHTIDGGATWIPQLSERGAWFSDVGFADRFDGWVVAEVTDPATQIDTSRLYRTTDGGVSWTSADHPSQPTCNALARIGTQTGWVVGRSGYVARTTDGGATWVPQVSNTVQYLNDVSFVDAFRGVAVGRSGATTRTTDGGAVWTSAAVAGNPGLAAVDMVDTARGWAVGSAGAIVVTTDGGANWTPQTSGTTRSFDDVDFASATAGWAVGQSGTVLRTTDGGQTWPAAGPGTTETIWCVRAFSADVAHIGGDGGWTLRTTDGGATWAPLPARATTVDLGAVDFVSPLLGWAVGAGGSIIHTTDGGASWGAQGAPTTQTLYTVDFVDGQNGWAAGSLGAIVRTTNGGETWLAPLAVPQPSAFCRDVSFATPATGWVITPNRAIHHTTDAGASWQGQDPGLTGTEQLLSIDCVDAIRAWAVGSEGAIVHTTDGGATAWVKQTSPVTGASFQDVDFADADHGWAVGGWSDPVPPNAGWSLIAATTDGGDTWSAQYFEPGQTLKSIAMGDAQTGWAVDWIGGALRTTDGGETWTPRVSGVTSEMGGLCAFDAGHAWMVGRFGRILTTASGDDVAPVARATGAASGWYRTKRTLTFSATDAGATATGVGSIEYQVDGGAWTKGARLSVPAPASHANDGLHVIRFRATDWAGNVSAVKALKIGIDTRRPRALAPYGATAYAGRRATLRFKVVDAKPNGGTAKVVVRIRNSRGTTVKTLRFGLCAVNKLASRKWSCALPRGAYRFVVYATDRAGNTQSSTGSNRLTVR